MSDRRHRLAIAVVAAVALHGASAASLTAQRSTPRPTQYDVLRDYWAARSAVASSRLKEFRHAVDSANSDTTHALRLDIVSTPELSMLAGSIARLADSLTRQTWLPQKGDRRAQFELRRSVEQNVPDFENAIAAPPPKRTIRLAAREPDGSIKDLSISDSAHVVTEAARMAVTRAVVDPALGNLPRDLREWMVHQPAAELPTLRDWRWAWRELAAYPSLPARGCLVGELRACQTALALTEERTPLQTFYDADLRRALAARWLNYSTRHDMTEEQAAMVNACAAGRDDAACLRFLGDRTLGASMVEPGPAQLRTLFVRYAFSFPTDSTARAEAAFSSGLSVVARLERASGLPIQELIRRFHGQLSERRPPPIAPGSTLLWSASLWFVAFGVLSLRSSRWRG